MGIQVDIYQDQMMIDSVQDMMRNDRFSFTSGFKLHEIDMTIN
jgi:hypothetical protein